MFDPRVDAFGRSGWCQVQKCMHIFPNYRDSQRKRHSGRDTSHLLSLIHWGKVPWGHCHHIHICGIPQFSNIGFHKHQACLHQSHLLIMEFLLHATVRNLAQSKNLHNWVLLNADPYRYFSPMWLTWMDRNVWWNF